VHLLAAAGQQGSAVLAQAAVDGKTNEITAFVPLLEPPGPARIGDHRRRDAHPARARPVPGRRQAVHYILVAKKNQPNLDTQVKNLLWRLIPAGDRNATADTAEKSTVPSRPPLSPLG
jgi:hypothetical protein